MILANIWDSFLINLLIKMVVVIYAHIHLSLTSIHAHTHLSLSFPLFSISRHQTAMCCLISCHTKCNFTKWTFFPGNLTQQAGAQVCIYALVTTTDIVPLSYVAIEMHEYPYCSVEPIPFLSYFWLLFWQIMKTLSYIYTMSWPKGISCNCFLFIPPFSCMLLVS